MRKIAHRFPRIGLRIVKSALVVGICCLIYYALGYRDIPFFFVIAAMQCMQPYSSDVLDVAKRNIYGTLIGAFGALVIILLQYFVLDPYHMDFLWYCLLVTLGIVWTLYTAVVVNCGDMAYFACVVFLCMIRIHISDEGPFAYLLQRLAETFAGIALGTFVNALHLPRRKTADTLFVASLDEILHSEISHLSSYSKVELNRILDEGIPLSVIAKHSVASFKEAGNELRLKLPVILMDGAVIYDPVSDMYLEKAELSHEEAMEISSTLESFGLDTLKSSIVDESLLIFYNELNNEGSRSIFERLRRSPYRNYIRRELPEGLGAIYIHAVNSCEKINLVYEELIRRGFNKKYRIETYESTHCPGYSYIRVFSLEADRRKMVEKLRQITGLGKAKTFGNDPDIYDVFVNTREGEGIIKTLKREFEPLIWIRKSKKS